MIQKAFILNLTSDNLIFSSMVYIMELKNKFCGLSRNLIISSVHLIVSSMVYMELNNKFCGVPNDY
jgi:hypothetical protein